MASGAKRTVQEVTDVPRMGVAVRRNAATPMSVGPGLPGLSGLPGIGGSPAGVRENEREVRILRAAGPRAASPTARTGWPPRSAARPSRSAASTG